MTVHVTFPAIGTTVFLAVRDRRDVAVAERLARRVLADVDATCSRFRDDSDLTLVNRSPGRWVAVDPLLVAAVDVACAAARSTDGLVHPLLGRPLVQLGYDRDFGLLRECDAAWPRAGHLAAARSGARSARTPTAACASPRTQRWTWAPPARPGPPTWSRRRSSELRGSSVVSVGGDVRVAGPDGRPWPVGVSERPGRAADETVALRAGAARDVDDAGPPWTRDGVRRHHLLDPRTGLRSPEVWRTVTAVGTTCVGANTASTAAIVLGPGRPGLAHDGTAAARLVHRTGQIRHVGGWPAASGGGGMSDGPMLWYLNRAPASSLLVLLTATVVLGVLVDRRTAGSPTPGLRLPALHRNLALFGGRCSWCTCSRPWSTASSTSGGGRRSCPFGATYEPLWLGLGAVRST